MKRFFQSEIGAAVGWVLCSLVLAALISPWLYQAGMHLAEVAENQTLPALVEWLAAACGRSRFSRYYDRALLLSALVFLPLLFRRIRTLRAIHGTGPVDIGVRIPWQSALSQVVLGCAIAGGMLWAMAAMLDMVGAYAPAANPPAPSRLLSKILVSAVVVSVLEECLFRGLLLGLWLRFARPATACLGSALLFAFMHFLKPPEGALIANPADGLAGFELLGKMLLHFTDPCFFVTDFATLLACGLILAWVRVRTGALWFSIGMHAGWIIIFKGSNLLYQSVPGHFLHPWGVGGNLRSGVLPLLTLGFTAGVCHLVLRRFDLPERRDADLEIKRATTK